MSVAGVICAIRKADCTVPVAPGTKEASCKCGATILLSRASLRRVKRGYVALCSICMQAAYQIDPDRFTLEFPSLQDIAETVRDAESN